MATLTLKDGRVFEGTIEELAELAKKLDESNPEGFRKVEGREPRVGDYVKFFEDGYDITAGKYYEIINFDDDGDFVFLDDDGDSQSAFLDYLGEDFEVFEEISDEEPLKVGDYVVPLESADDEYAVTNTEMKLGKVVEGYVDYCDDIRIEVIAHENDIEVGESYSVNSKHFRKATDEEVAQAMQAKAEQKWAKIGRKPGEFKKGDIVRVVNSPSASPIGTLAEVADVDVKLRTLYAKGWSSSLFRLVEYSYGFDDVELIAPVESRVDIDD